MLSESERYAHESEGEGERRYSKSEGKSASKRAKAYGGGVLKSYSCTWRSPPNGPAVWHLGHKNRAKWTTGTSGHRVAS
jgi:hypothetical protein